MGTYTEKKGKISILGIAVFIIAGAVIVLWYLSGTTGNTHEKAAGSENPAAIPAGTAQKDREQKTEKKGTKGERTYAQGNAAQEETTARAEGKNIQEVTSTVLPGKENGTKAESVVVAGNDSGESEKNNEGNATMVAQSDRKDRKVRLEQAKEVYKIRVEAIQYLD